jgi:hypothetical protein
MTTWGACCRTAGSTPLPIATCAPDGRHVPVLLSDLLDLPTVPFGNGPAELALGCAADRPHARSRHAVRVDSDWSVDTPHDAHAESVALALGGPPLGCLDFVERVLPAVRAHMQLLARRVLPPIAGQADGVWRAAHSAGCCRTRTAFSTASEAAAHVRGVTHLALLHAADVKHVRRFAAAAVRHCREGSGDCAWSDPSPEEREAACHVSEEGGLRRLWDAGMHPRLVCRAHALLGADEPLPVRCYLAMLGRRPDLVWIAETAALAAGRRLHSWLAETETALDREQPEARARWLRTGNDPWHVHALSSAGYSAADVAVLAEGTPLAPTDAVAALRSWTARGLAPSAASLSALQQRGFLVRCPVDRADLRGLRRLLAQWDLGADVSDDVLALLLLVTGQGERVFLWAQAGWTDPVAVADAIARGEQPATATAPGS